MLQTLRSLSNHGEKVEPGMPASQACHLTGSTRIFIGIEFLHDELERDLGNFQGVVINELSLAGNRAVNFSFETEAKCPYRD